MTYGSKSIAGHTPTISVVMTTYNGAAFLGEQLDSILQQSFTDFELIATDDCSRDGTVAMLEDYARRDPRMRVIARRENGGIHRNLELALQQARGQYIAIADQDDVWDRQKLEILLAAIGEHSAAYSDSALIDAKGRLIGQTLIQRVGTRTPATGHRALAILRKNCVSGHAMLFRQTLLAIILPFSDALMFDQQIGFLAALERGLVYVDRPLVRHRIHGNNQVNGGLATDRRRRSVAEHVASRCERYRDRRLNLARAFQYACDKLLAHGFERAGRRYAGLAARLHFISRRLQAFDNSYLDLRLLWAMFALRDQLFYDDESSVFRQCLKYAKGARYYCREPRRSA